MKILTPLGNLLFFILASLAFWSIVFFSPDMIRAMIGG